MKTSRKGIIYNLGRIKAIHILVSALGIYRAVNFFLRTFPIIRRLPRHETVIRIKSVTGLALAEEVFQSEAYHDAIDGISIQTFADLGCNVGWFSCYLLETTGNKGISGLLIDADPEMVAQAQWHMKQNGLTECQALWGVVGCASETGESDFFVNPANTQSSAKAFGENHPFPVKGSVKKIRVPALSLAKTWISQFGDSKIDLLKVDIEGAELDFLKAEMSFLQSNVRRIVCEWHKWHVSFEELDQYFKSHQFQFQQITEEDKITGVAIYDNTALKA